MAIKVGGSTVIDDSRALINVTNLKTINGNSILGSGDISIPAGATGPQGLTGPTGATGPQGPAGVNATTTTVATTSVNGLMSSVDKTKLDGIVTANLLNRANHTGEQAISTVTGLQAALDTKSFTGHTHNDANVFDSGFMTSADKVKLDGIAESANNYVHPANHPASIITQDASNRFVTDAEKTTWNAKLSSVKTINGQSIVGTGDLVVASNSSSTSDSSLKGTGKLTKLKEVAVSNFPYDIIVHPNGKFIYVSNNYSKTISQYSFDESTGVLTEITPSILVNQSVYNIIIHKSGNMLYVATSSSKICQYSINTTTGVLTLADNSAIPTEPTYDLTFNSDQSKIYAVGPYGSSTNFIIYSVNPTTYLLTKIANFQFTIEGTQNIVIDSESKFLYVTSYNNDKVSSFSINGDVISLVASYGTGTATSPYGLCIDKTGNFLYVSCGNVKKIVAFSINKVTGNLTQLDEYYCNSGGELYIEPTGNYLYTSGSDSSSIDVFAINANGSLTLVQSFPAGVNFISSITSTKSGNLLLTTHSYGNKILAYAINNASFGSLDIQGNLTVGQKINDLNFGFGSGNVNTNTVIGKSAFVSNGTDGWAPGVGNTAIGHETLLSNTAGGCNTGIGADALRSNTNSSHNTSIGWYAMRNLSTGSPNNTAVGSQSMQALSSGTGNTAIGQSSMTSAVSGSGNTAVGYKSLSWTNSGSSNTCVGSDAMSQNTTGFENTCIGTGALLRNTTGSRNVGLGYGALAFNTSGSGNVSIGPTTAAGTISPVFNATTENNRVVMGSTAVTNAYVQVAWTVVSDARDKTNFAPVPHGLDFVKKLKPVAYQFKVSREDDTPHGGVKYGFKAQDILELEGDSPVIIDNETPDKLKFVDQHLIAVMVKAIQELTAKVEELEARSK